jgi:hypothetical protein
MDALEAAAIGAVVALMFQLLGALLERRRQARQAKVAVAARLNNLRYVAENRGSAATDVNVDDVIASELWLLGGELTQYRDARGKLIRWKGDVALDERAARVLLLHDLDALR